MALYRLAVRRSGDPVRITVSDVTDDAVWSELERLAGEHPEPGTRITVQNDRGEIVIAVGVRTIRAALLQNAAA
jgi:hypothetical protein